MGEEFLSVSQLNNYIKDVLDAGFPQALWVCGEIQNYDRNKGRTHVFFELVEKKENSSEIVAKIGLVIFANRKSHIQSILKESRNAFELKDDIEVKFKCKVNFYAAGGNINLIVEDIDPVYTLGKLAQEKQKLIALLTKNGTLERNKAVALSPVPLNIGLITAHDSAAFNDFHSELVKSRLGFRVYIRNAVMQGKRTEGDVCDAISELCAIKELDAIVISRGGGSLADLSFFDSQKIAEAIAACRLPVLTGIGHEINTSVADLAAHTFAKTPTAIAQFLVQRIESFLEALDERFDAILRLVEEKIDAGKRRLKDGAVALQSGTNRYLKDHSEQIIRFVEIIKGRPVLLLKEAGRNMNTLAESLLRAAKLRFSTDKERLASYQKMVALLHPENTLKRGFSITRSADGKVIRQVNNLQKDDAVSTQLVDGVFTSRVVSIKKGE